MSVSSRWIALPIALFATQLHAQTHVITANWDVDITVDARKAKNHSAAAQAAESSLKLLGGSVRIASMTDQFTLSANSYALTSKAEANAVLASLLPNSTASRSSRGKAGGGYLMTQTFTEERTKGNERKVQIDYTTKVANYYKTGKLTKRESVKYRTADIATMPYLFYKQPLPTAATTVAATDGISTRIFVLDPVAENIKVGNASVPALRLTRRQYSQDDAGLVLWIRKSDGFPLRARIDLNAKYGVILEQKLKALPSSN